jgi:hypothetical protein
VEQIGIYELKDQPLGTEVIGDAPDYYLGLLRLPATPGTITAYASDGGSSRWKNLKGNTIRGVALQPGIVRIFQAKAR